MNSMAEIEEWESRAERHACFEFWFRVFVDRICIPERITNAILENLLNLKRGRPDSELEIDYQTSSTLLLWIQNPCIVSS